MRRRAKEAKGTLGLGWEAAVLLSALLHPCGVGRGKRWHRKEDPAGYGDQTIAWARAGVPRGSAAPAQGWLQWGKPMRKSIGGLGPGQGADPTAPASPAEVPGSASELLHVPGRAWQSPGSAVVPGHRPHPSFGLGLLGNVPAPLLALAVPEQPEDQYDPL